MDTRELAERVHALFDGLVAEQLLAKLEALFGLVFGVHDLLHNGVPRANITGVIAGLDPAIQLF